MILKSYYIQALVLGMENGKQCGLYHHTLAHNIQQEALMPPPPPLYNHSKNGV